MVRKDKKNDDEESTEEFFIGESNIPDDFITDNTIILGGNDAFEEEYDEETTEHFNIGENKIPEVKVTKSRIELEKKDSPEVEDANDILKKSKSEDNKISKVGGTDSIIILGDDGLFTGEYYEEDYVVEEHLQKEDKSVSERDNPLIKVFESQDTSPIERKSKTKDYSDDIASEFNKFIMEESDFLSYLEEFLNEDEKIEMYNQINTSIKVNMMKKELIDPIGINSTYIKDSFLWKYIRARDKNLHTTIDLLADLYIELNKYPEILASIFPERVNRFPENELSVIWGKYKTFITKWKGKIREKKQIGFRDEDLELLRTNIHKILGNKAGNCFKIINLYKSERVNYVEFINRLTQELGKYSYKLALTMEEFSLILGGYVNFTNDIIGKKNKPSHQRYNPSYKFSIERLEDIKDNIRTIFGDSAKNCFKIIENYKKRNPDIKKYKHQQYTIKAPRFFKNIEIVIVSYFFGLMCSDGYKSSISYRIGIELHTADIDRLILFAKAIGFDMNRIKERIRYHRINNKLKAYQISVMQFTCKDMYHDLDNLQFSEFKENQIGLPDCIVYAVSKAKQEALKSGIDWMSTDYGLIALAFLLGYYDGDGNLDKRGNQMSVRIYSSNKKFLNQIKEVFEIENDVLTNTEPGEIRYIFGKPAVSRGYYLLTLGVRVFTGMLKSFSDSMQRKRPLEYRNS